MKHSCHWKSCQKKKRLTGLRRHVSACKPHLKKRNSAKRYKFDIPDMPAFHKCMTGKMSYLLMKSTEGYTLCKEFGSRENLHHSASSWQWIFMGFEFPSWTPNIDLRYSLHFLVRIFLQKYWYCSRTMNPSTHQSTARIIWMPKKNRRCSLSSSFLFLYNHFHFNLDFNICGGIWRLRKQSISH